MQTFAMFGLTASFHNNDSHEEFNTMQGILELNLSKLAKRAKTNGIKGLVCAGIGTDEEDLLFTVCIQNGNVQIGVFEISSSHIRQAVSFDEINMPAETCNRLCYRLENEIKTLVKEGTSRTSPGIYSAWEKLFLERDAQPVAASGEEDVFTLMGATSEEEEPVEAETLEELFERANKEEQKHPSIGVEMKNLLKEEDTEDYGIQKA